MAMNLKIENNTYNYSRSDDITTLIEAENYKNIYGKDVESNSGSKLFPDSLS
jgi:hypothetical protein